MSGHKAKKRRKDHYTATMTDGQLIASWLLEFGDRPVTAVEVHRAHPDMKEVYHQLTVRELLDWKQMPSMDYFRSHIYTLKRTLSDADH